MTLTSINRLPLGLISGLEDFDPGNGGGGGGGGGGGTVTAIHESFMGNGSAAYTLTGTPPSKESLHIVLGSGATQALDQFSLSGKTITFNENIDSTTKIDVFYLIGNATVGVAPISEQRVGNNTAGPYTMLAVPTNDAALTVRIGGVEQPKSSTYYTWSGDQITFTESIASTENWSYDILAPAGIGVPGLETVGASEIKLSDIVAIRNKLQAQAALGYTPANKAGELFTGDLTIATPSHAILHLTKNGSGNQSGITGRNGSNRRWAMRVGNGVAETGSNNTGSDFAVERYADNDAYLDTPIYIARTNGIVQMPKQPAFSALKNDGGAYSTQGIIAYNSGWLNNGNHWNGSRFTAPVAGNYMFAIKAHTEAAGGLHLHFLKNGVYYAGCYGVAAGGSMPCVGGTIVLPLAVGDYVESKLNAGTAWAGNGDGILFSGHLVG